MPPSFSSIQADTANTATTKMPILWALLALAYMFEIGAVAVVIKSGVNRR